MMLYLAAELRVIIHKIAFCYKGVELIQAHVKWGLVITRREIIKDVMEQWIMELHDLHTLMHVSHT